MIIVYFNYGFNTQPPEGGWKSVQPSMVSRIGFNTQPPEGGWDKIRFAALIWRVSTHSRLKAAGRHYMQFIHDEYVSTHSRLKAAGSLSAVDLAWVLVSTHSRLKAAGAKGKRGGVAAEVSTHSRLKAAGFLRHPTDSSIWFQHTAA